MSLFQLSFSLLKGCFLSPQVNVRGLEFINLVLEGLYLSRINAVVLLLY